MLKLNEKYFIETDSCNYILQEKKIGTSGKSKGKKIFKNIGYFGRIEDLYNALIEKEIKENIELLRNIVLLMDLKEEIKNFVRSNKK